MWIDEINNGGRDYITGIKILMVMEKIGLKNVGVRMNDSVKFISPKSENYANKINSFIKHKGYKEIVDNYDKNNLEINEFEKNEIEIAKKILSNINGQYIIQSPCTFISFGTK